MTGLAEAVAALHDGDLIVMPTDTVYGLAGRADMADAVTSIFEIKSRPSDRALPILGANVEDLRSVARFSKGALRLAAAFWPGPVTLVVERAPRFTFDLGGRDTTTVAVRVPAHPLALQLLGETGPLAVTSANLSGGDPASTTSEARAALGDSVVVYLDGGALDGAPSTVVRVIDHLEILREGAVGRAELAAALRDDQT